MDSLISAAARALAGGDALGALKRVALRDDPPALALRGIAMAQLGEHPRARKLLRRAARGFGTHEELAKIPALFAPRQQLHPLGRMHEGEGQDRARCLLSGKVSVFEGHRLAGTDRPVERG